MKLCLATTPIKTKFSPLLFAGDFETCVKKASEFGYDGIELNIRDSTKIDQRYILDQLEKYNLKLISIGTGQAYYEDGISFADSNPKIREETINRIRDHIIFAKKTNAQVVIGGIRGTFSKDQKKRDIEYLGALDAIKQCAKIAEENNVILTLEPINKNDTSFINTIKEAIDYIQKINSDSVKIVADTYQMQLEGESIPEKLELAGNLLTHVHLVDSDRLVPGKGKINFEPIIKKLKEMDYLGYLSAEILPNPDDETAAKEFITNVRNLL